MAATSRHPFRPYYDLLAGVLVVVILVDLSIIVLRKNRVSDLRIDRSRTTALSMRIDPNEATAADLDCIPGIGEKLAQRICDYRREYQRQFPNSRAFTTLDNLTYVKGISDRMLQKIRPFLVIPPTEK